MSQPSNLPTPCAVKVPATLDFLGRAPPAAHGAAGPTHASAEALG